VREHDIEPDALLAFVGCALVRALHDRRSAARADDEVPHPFFVALAAAGELRELAGLFDVRRLGLQPLRDLSLLVVRGSRDQRVGHVGPRNPRGSVKYEGRGDPRLLEEHLGFEQLELETDGPQILSQQEVHILEGELVGFALRLRTRRHVASGVSIDLGGREYAFGRG